MADEVKLSGNAEKVLKAMRDAGYVGENKACSAEKVVAASKLPKSMAMNALQELEKAGRVVKKMKNSVASYYVAPAQ
ncbi:MAG: hypothetical protein QW728_01195 [Thermoplasmata archaeon]